MISRLPSWTRNLVVLAAACIATHASADAPAEPQKDESDQRTKIIAAAAIGGIHVAYATWSYFAWYRDTPTNEFFIGHDSWFGRNSYAGGADKLGHFWSNYVLSRGTTQILIAAGWRPLPSSLLAAGLTQVAFTITEVEDGFVKYGFDPKDLTANLAGSALAIVMDNIPAVDRLFDVRLQYFPSSDFRQAFGETNSVDVGQDYTGQSYMLAMHVGALPRIAEHDWGYWSRYVDICIGFEARHYSPVPEIVLNPPQQRMYAGIAINMQGVLRSLFDDSLGRRIGLGAFEVYSIPLTTFRYVEASRTGERM